MWCNATGIKYPMTYNGTGFTNVCPVCLGAGTITVTETQETQDVAFTQDIKEIK
jgi:hypothetical protein